MVIITVGTLTIEHQTSTGPITISPYIFFKMCMFSRFNAYHTHMYACTHACHMHTRMCTHTHTHTHTYTG